jgi:2,5-diamino-6-(ribosylamino)-4(3H)-pyrimidinone 5'-phosphate reductase
VRPRVVVHNEISVDGRMDLYAGDMGLYYEIAARLGADASLVGSQTLITGMSQFGEDLVDESSESRPAKTEGPLLAVVDSRGRVKQWPLLKCQPFWGRIVVLCSSVTPQSYTNTLERLGIEYLVHGGDHVDLAAALEELARRFGVETLRVDSGGTLTGVLLRSNLVDEVSILIDPCVVGGESPASMFRAGDLATPEGLTKLKLREFERLRDDVVWLRYDVVRP